MSDIDEFRARVVAFLDEHAPKRAPRPTTEEDDDDGGPRYQADIPTAKQLGDWLSMRDVLLYEFKADLNKYLTWLGAASPVHSLKDVIAFNDAHTDQEMPYFGQEIMAMAEKKGPLTSAKYVSALARNRQLARGLGIDATIDRKSVV